MLFVLFALILFVISVLIHMVGLYIGWTIALAIGGAVVSAIMAPVMAFNSALAKKAEQATGLPATPKAPYILLACEVALVVFLIVKPSANVFGFADKTASIDIIQRYFDRDGTVSEPITQPVTDEKQVKKLIDVLDSQQYKRTFQKYVQIDMPGPQYVLVLKDKNGNTTATVSINSSQSITILKPDGSSANYNVYFGNPEGDRRINITSIDSRFVTPQREKKEDKWADFIQAVDHAFDFADGKMTFTMPPAPEGGCTEFSLRIEKVLQDGNKRKFVEIYNTGTLDYVPEGDSKTWPVADGELLYIKVVMSLDNLSKPLEMRHIPDRYKYDNKK